MTKTTGKASRNTTGKQNNVPVKGKGKGKARPINRNVNGSKHFSRQKSTNVENGAKLTSKGNGKPNKHPNAPKGKGASGTPNSSAAPTRKVKKVSFKKNEPTIHPRKKGQKNPKKAIPTKKQKEEASLSKDYKELLNKVQPTLATLPKFMQALTSEFTLSMLTHHSQIQHKLNVLKKINAKPDYIPASARFKFDLTCCNDLTNDARQQSDAETVNQSIKTSQLVIRDMTMNTVEREIEVLKKKLIDDAFYFTFKAMKTGLILFKTKHSNLIFNCSDNLIVKTGIVQYFNEQKHEEYQKYFDISKIDLVAILIHFKIGYSITTIQKHRLNLQN